MILYAHRGCCRKELCSENSAESCIEALRKGLSIEVDVRVSKDGELVCIHDETLYRTHGSRRCVKHTTADELERLGVVRLATILDQVARYAVARIMLDIKIRPASGPLFVAESLCRARSISLARVSAIIWPNPSNFFPSINPPSILLASPSSPSSPSAASAPSAITLYLGLETVPKRLNSHLKAVTLPANGQREIDAIFALQQTYPSLAVNVYCEGSIFNSAFSRLSPKTSYTVSF